MSWHHFYYIVMSSFHRYAMNCMAIHPVFFWLFFFQLQKKKKKKQRLTYINIKKKSIIYDTFIEIEKLMVSFHYPFLIAITIRFCCFIKLSSHLLQASKSILWRKCAKHGSESAELNVIASFMIVCWITLYKAGLFYG